MVHLLVTGGTGQIGQSVQALNWPNEYKLILPSHEELNLADAVSVTSYLAKMQPDAIVNCAAYTAVDRAESEAGNAFSINGRAPELFARYAARHDIPMLHISTDYVFDGTKSDSYVEDDGTGPLGVYGASKLAGERSLLASGARFIIIRTAWVLSPFGHNFVKTMLQLGAERGEISVVNDQIGNPTSAHDIAEVIRTMVLRLLSDPNCPTGIYHFVNHGNASWFDLAKFVFTRSASTGQKAPILHGIATAQYQTAARRPANSRLSTGKITKDFAIHPRSWQSAINSILDDLLKRDS